MYVPLSVNSILSFLWDYYYSYVLILSKNSTQGHFGGCDSTNLCAEDEGDCDHDSECKEGLKCGTDHCPVELSHESFFDCCYKPCEGNDCCSDDNLCGINQGDCDFDHQCQFGLRCGSNNCPASLGFESEFDCCFQGCKSHRILINNFNFN